MDLIIILFGIRVAFVVTVSAISDIDRYFKSMNGMKRSSDSYHLKPFNFVAKIHGWHRSKSSCELTVSQSILKIEQRSPEYQHNIPTLLAIT